MGWDSWVEETFGTPFEIWHDGLAIGRFDHFSDEERAAALGVLPEGIRAQNHVAAVGARMLQAADLVPDLEAAIDGARGTFLVEAARALDTLGGDVESARAMVIDQLRREPSWALRMELALGLRYLEAPGVTDALLDAVAGDPDYLVRYHAAESLLALGSLEPLRISDHGELFGHIASDDPGRHRTAADLLGKMLRGAQR